MYALHPDLHGLAHSFPDLRASDLAIGRAEFGTGLGHGAGQHAVAGTHRRRIAVVVAEEVVALILKRAIDVGTIVDLVVGLVRGEIMLARGDVVAALVIRLQPHLVAPLQDRKSVVSGKSVSVSVDIGGRGSINKKIHTC